MRPLLALVTVQFLFATLAVVGKYVLNNGLGPFALAAIRVFLAAIILSIIAYYRPRGPVARRDWLALAGLALLGVAFNQLLFLKGLQLSSAVNASLLVATIPIFTLIVAVALRRESFDILRLSGVLAGLAGALLLLRVERFDASDQTQIGNLLVVLNCLSYSLYLVLSRPLLHKYPSPIIVAWTFLLGSLVIVPVGLPQLLGEPAGVFTATVILGLAWIVLGPSVGSYALNNYALKRLHASTVATFIFLQPLFGVLMAVLFLGETVGARDLAAGSLVVLGVLLVGRREAQPPVTNPKTLEPGTD